MDNALTASQRKSIGDLLRLCGVVRQQDVEALTVLMELVDSQAIIDVIQKMKSKKLNEGLSVQ